MAASVRLLAGNRKKGETSKAIQACNDYLRMGPGRSLRKLEADYVKTEQNRAPTKSIGTLTEWSARYGWQERAETYDARIEEEKNRRQREIMESGLAMPHARVIKLKQLTDLLLDETYIVDEDGNVVMQRDNVWLPDVKQIGGGEYAERVDIVRFNASLIEQVRGLLDDLAKETGGRKQTQEITGKDGQPLEVKVIEGPKDVR